MQTIKYFVTNNWKDSYLDAVVEMKNTNPTTVFGLFFQDPVVMQNLWNKAQTAGITAINLIPDQVGIYKLSDQQKQNLINTTKADAQQADTMASACSAMNFKTAAILDNCYKFEF